MKSPIFVHQLDCRDIENFSGIRAAETQLEAIDVQNGEYDVYDAGGTKLNPQVWTDSNGVERVIILEADGAKNCGRGRARSRCLAGVNPAPVRLAAAG